MTDFYHRRAQRLRALMDRDENIDFLRECILHEVRVHTITAVPGQLLYVSANGKLPYEAFDDVEAEALAHDDNNEEEIATTARRCSDVLRKAASCVASAEDAKRHEELSAAALIACDKVLVDDEHTMKALAEDLWRLVGRNPDPGAQRIVRGLRRALEKRILHPATLSAQPFLEVQRKLECIMHTPRIAELQQACAECVQCIDEAKAPFAMAVMQGTAHTRVGRGSLLQQLDAELVRRMILRSSI